jgi:hypothetical protein
MSPLNAAICTTTYLERQKCYGPGKKILFKFFLFDLEVKGHYSMWHTALWSCTHIPNKYYLKNNYLTLRSKIKVPRRSLWYATHRLMVMHPHTKYHWPISKDENVIYPDKKILFKKQLFNLEVKGPTKVITVCDTALWSCTHIPNKYYLKNNYLTLRSKVITVRDTPPYGHAPTYQISLTYLERRKCYGPDKKILFKK